MEDIRIENIDVLPNKKAPRKKSLAKNSPRLEVVTAMSEPVLVVQPQKKEKTRSKLFRTPSKLLSRKEKEKDNITPSSPSRKEKKEKTTVRSRSLRDLTDRLSSSGGSSSKIITPRKETKKEKPEQPMIISSVVQSVHVEHVGQENANQFLLRLLKLRDEKFAHIHHEIRAGPRSGYIDLRPSTNMSNQFRNLYSCEKMKKVREKKK